MTTTPTPSSGTRATDRPAAKAPRRPRRGVPSEASSPYIAVFWAAAKTPDRLFARPARSRSSTEITADDERAQPAPKRAACSRYRAGGPSMAGCLDALSKIHRTAQASRPAILQARHTWRATTSTRFPTGRARPQIPQPDDGSRQLRKRTPVKMGRASLDFIDWQPLRRVRVRETLGAVH